MFKVSSLLTSPLGRFADTDYECTGTVDESREETWNSILGLFAWLGLVSVTTADAAKW
jgi:hypothetical protein